MIIFWLKQMCISVYVVVIVYIVMICDINLQYRRLKTKSKSQETPTWAFLYLEMCALGGRTSWTAYLRLWTRVMHGVLAVTHPLNWFPASFFFSSIFDSWSSISAADRKYRDLSSEWVSIKDNTLAIMPTPHAIFQTWMWDLMKNIQQNQTRASIGQTTSILKQWFHLTVRYY